MDERIEISAQDFLAKLANNEYFHVESNSYLVRNLLILGELRINEISKKLINLNIINCEFNGEVFWEFNETKDLSIKDSIFYSKAWLKINTKHNIRLSNNLFKENVLFFGMNANYLAIHSSTFSKRCNFSFCKLEGVLLLNASIEFDGNVFEDQLSFYENSIKGNVSFRNTNNKSVIKQLLIADSNNYISGYEENIINVESLVINGIYDNVNFSYFKNMDIQKITFSNLYNFGRISFENIKSNFGFPEISFQNSVLGDLNFLNCQFDKYKLNYISSKISTISILGGKFPGPENFSETDIVEDKKDLIQGFSQFKKLYEANGDFINSTKFHEYELKLYNQILVSGDSKKLIYSQFKKMYEQRGDSVKALEYQAKELEEYRKSIKLFSKYFFEKITLTLNKCSNYYGTKWQYGLAFLLITSSIFFSGFLYFQGYRIGPDRDLFFHILPNYFDFLNPVRKPDFFKIDGVDIKMTNGGRIIDFFGRIVVTFAEYQLIQAFRKYGKK